jgi:hypothetical protein
MSTFINISQYLLIWQIGALEPISTYYSGFSLICSVTCNHDEGNCGRISSLKVCSKSGRKRTMSKVIFVLYSSLRKIQTWLKILVSSALVSTLTSSPKPQQTILQGHFDL